MDNLSRVRGPIRSQALRSNLEFEAQRLDLDIEIRECWTTDIRQFDFESRALICIRQAGEATEFEVPVPETDAALRLPVTLPSLDGEELITVETDDSEHPLAAVVGRELHLFFDPNALFERPANFEVTGDLDPDQAIRRLFEAVVPEGLDRIQENIAECAYEQERQAFARMKIQGWQNRCEQWQSDLRYNESDLESSCRTVERLARACADLRQKIQAFEEHTRVALRDQANQEFDQLRNMMPAPYQKVRVDGGTLRIETNPVVLDYQGESFELGRFEVAVRLSDFRLRIKACEDNQFVDDYFHPHLSVEGVPCWGNIAPAVSQLIGERELSGLLPVIWRFLTSYNAENPYIPLERWSPDYDSDAIFNECFEDAHPCFDCVGCSRNQCPFFDSRYDRCWQQIRADEDWQRCVGCSRCEHATDAREQLDAQTQESTTN